MKQLTNIATVMLAQTIPDLAQNLGSVLTILLMISFLLAVIGLVAGGVDIHRGDYDQGKRRIVAAALIAASSTIVAILFNAFGLGSAIIHPK